MGRDLIYVEPRFHVQFKVGFALYKTIQKFSDINEGCNSKNEWIVEAVQSQLKRGYSLKIKTSAVDILHDKVTQMVRLNPTTLDQVNNFCTEKDMSRTVWMIDACLSKIAEEKRQYGL